MPYQALLDHLVRSIDGVRGALLMDANGEFVVGSGPDGERLRLIGAYQGITLSTARKTAERYSAGGVECILSRYDGGAVVLRPLRDGYYLVIALSTDANVGQCLHRSALVRERLDAEL